MATIVGDKLKLTNYSYLLNSTGDGWNEEKFSNLREKSEKLIDAIDIDWRPFSINNCLGDGTYVSYEIKPGDFLETETLINYVSYAYSMSKGFSLNSSLDNNQFNKRPTLLTNLYFNSSNRTLSYQYWPSVGSVYNLTEIDKTNFKDNPEQFGEIFNDYKNNIAAGAGSHAEGLFTYADGIASHAEGFNTYAAYNFSHAEGGGTFAYATYAHAEGQNTIASGLCSHSQGSLTNAESNYSTAIGLGTYASYSDAEVALGKWNISKEGYLVTIGNGENDTLRNNVVEITNNGWTYVGALFSYVNNLTSTNNVIDFGVDSDNFIRINSFNDLNRTDTNSYNLIFNSYSIPTKNYIDRLLEAKDVLHFAGAVQLNASTSDNSGNISDVEWTHKNSISADYNPEDITYYLSSAYSAGALWKVTNSGYFGNIYCQAGDVLLSYDDSATSDNTNGWLLVGSHIGVIENEGTANTTYPVSNEYNQIVTNVNLSENGKLSYTFAPLVTTYSSVDNSGFLSNISLVKSNDKITIAYTHTEFVNSKQNGTAYNVSSADNEFGFISNVNLDNNGKLTYETSSVTDIKNHHNTNEEISKNYSDVNSGDQAKILSYVWIDPKGTLQSYYYTLDVANLSNNHHSSSGQLITYGDLEISNSNDILSFSYIANVYLSESGELSYDYSTYTIKNLSHHHGGSLDTESEGKVLNFGEDFTIIKRIILSSNGFISGDYTSYTLPSLSIDGIYTNSEPEEFVYGLNIDNTGKLTYSYAYIKKISTSCILDHNAIVNECGEKPTLITNLSFDPISKILSYSYWPAVGSVWKPYTYFTDDDLKGKYWINQGDYGEVFNDYENNIAYKAYSHSEGWFNNAYGVASHAEGCSNIARGDASHAEGNVTFAYGNVSHAEGFLSYSLGLASHSEGFYTYAAYNFSHAEGSRSLAYNAYTHAEGLETIALGEYSHTEGRLTQTIGNAAHAEGFSSLASGGASHSEGNITYATGINSHAEGFNTYATHDSSHSEGYQTFSYNNYAHSEGILTTASGVASHAEGQSNESSGLASHSEGFGNRSTGSFSHAEGDSTTANGQSSHAEGGETIARNNYSHAEGFKTFAAYNFAHSEGSETFAYNAYTHVEGVLTVAYGTYAHAEGFNTYAAYDCSHSEGCQTFSYNYFAHSEGILTTASGVASHAEGVGTIASGNSSHSEGNSTIANGQSSHAEGSETFALGNASHTEGFRTYASYNFSHAEGFHTLAYREHSHTEGDETTTYGLSSHAEGAHTLTIGDYSHVEGLCSFAKGEQSHAEGYHTYAYGICSHTEGNRTYALGLASHAGGILSYAYGDSSQVHGVSARADQYCSTAFGWGTYAINSEAEVALGRFNVSKPGYIFTFGDGITDDNRHNAFEITNNGYTYITKLAGVWDYWPPKVEHIETVDECFYIENLSSEQCVVTLHKKGSPTDIELEYSINNQQTWNILSMDSVDSNSFSIPANGKAYLIGGNSSFSDSAEDFYRFSFSEQCNIGGNLMSLVYNNDISPFMFYCLFADNYYTLISAENLILPDNVSESCYSCMFIACSSLISAPVLPATTLAENCYFGMFDSCKSLETVPALPATTLAICCYSGMFFGCSSLVNTPTLPATTLATECYECMFYGCTSLVNATSLPATTLTNYCYAGMFYGCTSLIIAPALPATTLANYCYQQMFKGCTSLVNAPALPATTLANYCCYEMFQGCTSLVNAPTLPATTLAGACYYRMFYGCTSLVNAPALPAITLAGSCYSGMFYGCTSLVNAPTLPATTLAGSCYYEMFRGCSNLKKIKAMFTTTPSTAYTNSWLSDVSSTGTFVKNKNANWDVTGPSGIPSGWKIREK